MPPRDNSKEAIVDYLTSLLAAIALDCDGELRIKRSALRRVTDETARQVLIEEMDSERDEIVLRFGSKHTVIYPIGGMQPSAKPEQVPEVQRPRPVPVSSNSVDGNPRVSPPLTDEQLQRAEQRLRQMRTAREILRERQRTEA